MNWTAVLGIICGILFSLVLVIIGYSGGKEAGKKEVLETEQPSNTFNQMVVQPTEAQIDDVKRSFHRYLDDHMIGPKGEPGPPGKTPDANDLLLDEDLGMTLAEWYIAVNNRLTRVEKKSGMAV